MATGRSGRKTGAGGKAGAQALGDEARGAGEAAASPPIGAAEDAARVSPTVVGDTVDASNAAGQAGARRRPRPRAPGGSKVSSPVKASKAAAKASKSAPEASKPVPKSSKPVPKAAKPAPKASAPTKMKRSAPASLGRAAAVQAARTTAGTVEASSGKAPGAATRRRADARPDDADRRASGASAQPTNVASEDASASAGARKALKPVRDSYTMPRVDYALFEVLKARALAFHRPTKKSELLRAGLQVLAALDAPALEAVLGRLVAIKTGRPRRR